MIYTNSMSSVEVFLGSGGIGGGWGGTATGDTLVCIENIIGSAHNDRLIGDNANNALTGWTGNDDLKGGGGSDVLSGGSGDDELRGGAGADTLSGGDGLDTLDYTKSTAGVTVAIISNVASGGHAQGDTFSGIEHITGSGHNDSLWGNDVWNRLDGAEGNDTLKGFGGEDILQGGAGNDTLYGMNDDDTLVGSYGDDTLVGGSGQDSMAGHGGNDTYHVDNILDVADEWVGGGFDTVRTTANYTLASGSEIEWLEAADQDATTDLELGGNAFANSIMGNAGDNVLDGGGNADHMYGLGGDDTYYVDHALDMAHENAGEGIDTVRTSVSYGLISNGLFSQIETLETADPLGTASLSLTGDHGENQIIGNDGDNVIDGSVGVDQMIGRDGDDAYFVDVAGDAVVENGGNGFDFVYAGTSYVLAEGTEVEWLTTAGGIAGTAAIDLTGNSHHNTVAGNNGTNVVNGGGGNDDLRGYGGQDLFLFDTTLDAATNVDVLSDLQRGRRHDPAGGHDLRRLRQWSARRRPLRHRHRRAGCQRQHHLRHRYRGAVLRQRRERRDRRDPVRRGEPGPRPHPPRLPRRVTIVEAQRPSLSAREGWSLRIRLRHATRKSRLVRPGLCLGNQFDGSRRYSPVRASRAKPWHLGPARIPISRDRCHISGECPGRWRSCD